MPQKIYGDVPSCQFFLLMLYTVEIYVVVGYLLIAYNIVFFKIIFNVFSYLCFLKHSLKRDPGLEHKSILSAKYQFHMSDLFVELEQVLHNRCPTITTVQL